MNREMAITVKGSEIKNYIGRRCMRAYEPMRSVIARKRAQRTTNHSSYTQPNSNRNIAARREQNMDAKERQEEQKKKKETAHITHKHTHINKNRKNRKNKTEQKYDFDSVCI